MLYTVSGIHVFFCLFFQEMLCMLYLFSVIHSFLLFLAQMSLMLCNASCTGCISAASDLNTISSDFKKY